VDGSHLFRFFQFYAHSFVFVYVYVFVCACVYVCMCVQLYEVFYHRCRFMWPQQNFKILIISQNDNSLDKLGSIKNIIEISPVSFYFFGFATRIFFFWHTGLWVQVPTFARQVLYHLSHAPRPRKFKMTCICTREPEAGGLWVQSQSGLHSETCVKK
jgi:hypothetical protein